MGAKNSKPKCKAVNCEPQVARVMQACNTAGSKAVDATYTAALEATFGPDIANAATTALNSVKPHPWLKSYAYTRPASSGNSILPDSEDNAITGNDPNSEFFTNYEGFIEGNGESAECVSCSCDEAANTIIARCNEASEEAPIALAAAITQGEPLLSPKTGAAVSKLIADEEETPPDNSFYRDVIAPGIKVSDTFTNIKEGFKEGNANQTSQFIVDAIQARLARFSNEPGFATYCALNSKDAFNAFKNNELDYLNSLYNYYNTYVNNYDTIYIHKERVSKIIRSKVEELDKIQEKIDKYKTNLHVDDRKNIYQNKNYDLYKYVYNFVVLAYYCLFILYLIVSKFFSEKQYNNKKILLILFIYLIIPIILNNVINLTYEGYNYILESNNFKEDTKSYVDLIKDN